jgi:small-conductance mechanosensitive channel
MYKELFQTHFYHNTLFAWLLAALTVLGIGVVLRLVKILIIRRLRVTASQTETMLDDIVLDMARRTHLLFHVAMGIAAATFQLDLPAHAEARLRTGVILVSILQAGLWGSGLVQFLIVGLVDRRAEPGDVTYRTGKNMLRFAGLLLVWSAVVLLSMENIGINVSTLVAGLGVTGVAVAFATQNILSDLIASVSILLDKPFLVGDFIICDAFMGTVEKIGVRTTRLRSLSGEGLIMANSDLSKSRIRNYKSLKERRIVFTFSIRYETPLATLQGLSGMIEKVVRSVQQTRFDRAHMLTFGESGLQYEVVYYVLMPDYTLYCDIQQNINLKLMQLFVENNIEFSYRTQINYTYNYDGKESMPSMARYSGGVAA